MNRPVLQKLCRNRRTPVRLIALALAVLLSSCGLAEERADRLGKARDAAAANASLGAKYMQRGELEEARDKLEKALQQDPDSALAHVAYGRLQQRIGQPKKAREHFKRAIAIEPEEAEHRNAYGIFLCEQGEVPAAQKEFARAADNPFYETPEFALDNAGLCMLDSGNLDAAGSYLRKALQKNPQFGPAYLHMAELMYQQQRLNVAQAYLERFQTYNSESAASLWLGLQIQRDSGNLGAAEDYASRLLNDFPASDEAGEYLTRPVN